MNPTDRQLEKEVSKVIARIKSAKDSWRRAEDISSIRESFEQLCIGDATPPPIESSEIAGVATEIFGAEYNAEPILYLHGGGFQIGSTQSHRNLIDAIARSSGRPLYGINYRLAPEHRFPAAIEDATAVYRNMAENASRVALAGDSAGASLALAVLQMARREKLRLPEALVLISPWLDLEMTGVSYSELKEQDVFSTPKVLALMARTYVGKSGNLSDPLVSPVNMDMTNVPPTLIHAGTADITLSDCQTFYQRARALDRDVRLRVWDGMFHHFQMFTELAESRDSIAEIGAFLRLAAPHSA